MSDIYSLCTQLDDYACTRIDVNTSNPTPHILPSAHTQRAMPTSRFPAVHLTCSVASDAGGETRQRGVVRVEGGR